MAKRRRAGVKKTLLCATRFWSLGWRKKDNSIGTLSDGVRHVVRKQGFTTVEINKAERELVREGKIETKGKGTGKTVRLTDRGNKVSCGSVELAPWTDSDHPGSALDGVNCDKQFVRCMKRARSRGAKAACARVDTKCRGVALDFRGLRGISFSEDSSGYMVYTNTDTGKKVKVWADELAEVAFVCRDWHGGQSTACYAMQSSGDFSPDTLRAALHELERSSRKGGFEDDAEVRSAIEVLNTAVDKIDRIDTSLDGLGDLSPRVRKSLESRVWRAFPRDSKTGRGDARMVMLTGRSAKVLGRKVFSRARLSELSDDQLQKLASMFR
jgi:hypothetical protein